MSGELITILIAVGFRLLETVVKVYKATGKFNLVVILKEFFTIS